MKPTVTLNSEIRNPSPATRRARARCAGRVRRCAGAIWPALAGAVCLAPALTHGQDIPAAINYQGKLTDSAGKALTNGLYQVDFRIWDTPTATNSAGYYWGRSFPIYVASNGMFNVALTDEGGTLSWPSSTGKVATVLSAFEGQPRYLGLRVTQLPGGPVTGPVEISPRQLFASAPYAIHAQQASSAASATVATNAVKFNNFSTNDFLMTNRTSQTLTGNLTITNGNLTVSSNLTVNRNATITSNLTVNGKLGIGVANPVIPLTFADGAGDKISFYGNTSGPHTGIGTSSTALQLHTPTSGTDIQFGYGDNANFTNTMTIQNAGKVGIGTSSPSRELEVQSPGDTEIGMKSTDTNGHVWTLQSSAVTGNTNLDASFQVVDRTAGSSRLTIKTNGNFLIADQSPIVIRRYHLTNMVASHSGAQAWTCTNYSTANWSAVVAGIHFYGDVEEHEGGRFLECRLSKGSNNNWTLWFDFRSDTGNTDYPVQEIYVDVMFIRKELVYDPDR